MVKKVGFLRIVLIIVLCLWLFWRYFVAPVLNGIDKVTPWDGLLPFVPIACGAAAPPPPELQGFPAMWHDLGSGVRNLADGPPSAEAMKAWFSGAGESTGRSVRLIRSGAAGEAKPIPLAPLPPPPGVTQVGAQGVLTDQQIAALAVEAGWPAAEVPNVVARVMAESTGRPTARDYDTGTHWGLLQLGEAERAQYIPGQDAMDPLVNLRGAKLLWDERGWQPWAASDAAVAVSASQVQPCAPSSGGVMQAGFGDHANGFIPQGELAAISGGGLLQPSAAGAFEQLNMAYMQAFRKPISVTDSYRDRAGQEACTRAKGNMCAKPGTSNHGWGLALDLGGGVNRFGTPQHTWMRANAAQYGWILPGWAQEGGSKPEPWHWEYIGQGAQQAG